MVFVFAAGHVRNRMAAVRHCASLTLFQPQSAYIGGGMKSFCRRLVCAFITTLCICTLGVSAPPFDGARACLVASRSSVYRAALSFAVRISGVPLLGVRIKPRVVSGAPLFCAFLHLVGILGAILRAALNLRLAIREVAESRFLSNLLVLLRQVFRPSEAFLFEEKSTETHKSQPRKHRKRVAPLFIHRACSDWIRGTFI